MRAARAHSSTDSVNRRSLLLYLPQEGNALPDTSLTLTEILCGLARHPLRAIQGNSQTRVRAPWHVDCRVAQPPPFAQLAALWFEDVSDDESTETNNRAMTREKTRPP